MNNTLPSSIGASVQPYKYGGKELEVMHGLNLYDFLARWYNLADGAFTSMDPFCEKYYHISPYAYCAGNPVKYVDPDGKDWYKTENGETEYLWTDCSSQKEMDNNNIEGKYMGEILVVFNGSRNEKLGKGNNLFGEGAVLATATIYGPNNKEDISEYGAFTMSSDFDTCGAIDDGEYIVNYDQKGKSGSLRSNWAINGRGPVNCLDGVNPSPEGYIGHKKMVFLSIALIEKDLCYPWIQEEKFIPYQLDA